MQIPTPRQAELLTVPETLAVLRLSKASLYSLLAHGKLPALKLGRKTVFRREDVEAFVGTLPKFRPRTTSD